MIKKYFIKKKIIKLFKENPNKVFHPLEISNFIYHSFLGDIIYYDWEDIKECLDILFLENFLNKEINSDGCEYYYIKR